MADATAKPTRTRKVATAAVQLPAVYRLFFLLAEPLAALAAAYTAAARPASFAAWLGADLDASTRVLLALVASFYVLAALHEALVLRATADQRVWRAVLAVLLLADAGRLAALWPLGARVYWSPAAWTTLAAWASVPFVYLCVALRIGFLFGIGFGAQIKPAKKA